MHNVTLKSILEEISKLLENHEKIEHKISKDQQIVALTTKLTEIVDFYNNRLNEENAPQYTAQRISKNDKLYGTIHYSDDAYFTFCGKEIDCQWYILTNNNCGIATCKTCLGIYKNRKKNGDKQK